MRSAPPRARCHSSGAALVLLAACGRPPIATPAVAPASVSAFRFAWSAGDRAVERTVRETSVVDDRDRAVTSGPARAEGAVEVAGSTATLAGSDRGLVIRRGEVSARGAPFVVDPRGAYVGLDDPAGAAAALGFPGDDWAADLLDRVDRAYWQGLAVALDGASTAAGTAIPFERTLVVDADHGWIAIAPSEVTVGAPVPCGDASPAGCVEVTLRTAWTETLTASAPSTPRHLDALRRGTRRVELEQIEQLVVRPADLRPIRLRSSRTTWREGVDGEGPFWEWLEERESACWAWSLASDGPPGSATACEPPASRPPTPPPDDKWRPRTILPSASGEPLGAALQREVGSGAAVAIVAGDAGLAAISADGARRRTLVTGPVPWALVDGRADVVWFGSADHGEIRLIDLLGRGDPETVAIGLPLTGIGPPKVTIAYPAPGDCRELTAGNPFWPRVALVLGPERARLDHALGYLVQWAPDAGFEDGVSEARIVDAPRLLALRRRVDQAPAPPAYGEGRGRVSVDVADCLGATTLCGEAQALTPTPFWRVLTGVTCGDACFATYTLYDPRSQAFVDADWADRASEASVAPDGSAFVADGGIYRFDTGPITPATTGWGGGWLGGGYAYPLRATTPRAPGAWCTP